MCTILFYFVYSGSKFTLQGFKLWTVFAFRGRNQEFLGQESFLGIRVPR